MPAPFACEPAASRGRLIAEEASALRTPFQRDRDRIIHSSAFRRLGYKTQVFVEHEGDHFRTRLTHSIEVAQVARTVAGVLGLNEALTEAVALAHDLGHTPFGHTGEEALADCMAPYGGFDHNAQAVRVVTALERHYAAFDGLNLTWETLEGIAKHNGPVTGALPYALAEYQAHRDLELATHASAEAQVAAIADDVAYNGHDLHDGLRAELFDEDDLAGLPLLAECFAAVDRAWPGLGRERRRHEALRRFLGAMIEDVVGEARRRLAAAGAPDAATIRHLGWPVVRFTDGLAAELRKIREFLFHRMYRASRVVAVRRQVAAALAELFAAFLAAPRLLPDAWQGDVARAPGETGTARVVADYLAGMTDRFALQEHARLCAG